MRIPAELIRAQAHPGWNDLIESTPHHGQSQCALGGPMVVAEGCSSSGKCSSEICGRALTSICFLSCFVEGFSPVEVQGKGSQWMAERTLASRYLTYFGPVFSARKNSWRFFVCPIFKQMPLILFLRFRIGLSTMQFLGRQQETDSFDSAIISISSSQCVSVCVPWAAVSTRGYLHTSTCKKGVSDQPRHLLLICMKGGFFFVLSTAVCWGVGPLPWICTSTEGIGGKS